MKIKPRTKYIITINKKYKYYIKTGPKEDAYIDILDHNILIGMDSMDKMTALEIKKRVEGEHYILTYNEVDTTLTTIKEVK